MITDDHLSAALATALSPRLRSSGSAACRRRPAAEGGLGDFGVFRYSPVDVKARDNVVFESGLFIGMKKADHAIILLPKTIR